MEVEREQADFMDVSPRWLFPLHCHDSIPGKRRRKPCLDGFQHAAAGCAMLKTESPIVGTGMEYKAGVDSGVCVIAKRANVVVKHATEVEVVTCDDGDTDINHKLLSLCAPTREHV